MEESELSKNKRIAKNTLYLYIRTVIVMGISLYTSRVILKALGETDFGIYNLVGSAVVLFTFINSAMTSSTQRYLNVAIGQKLPENITKVFSSSILIHFIIAGIFLVLAETVGLWFVTTQLNIPPAREDAAFFVYQFTVLTTCLKIIRCPYNAAIIAYEHMVFFAKISIVEAALKLGISFAILYTPIDRLVFYSLLILLSGIFITVWCKVFCDKNFTAIRISRNTDRSTIKSMMGFSLWSLLGSGSLMVSNQGINMLLNISYNVVVNAALGIAYQVNTVATTLVSNFQTAFMPQITKSYASGEIAYFTKLLNTTSRYSFLLFFIVSYPIFLNTDSLLLFWLGEYPAYTSGLVKVMIICVGIDALSGPLWMAVHAKGNIRNYQIAVSTILLLTIVACYLFARLGYSPVVAFGSRILLLIILYVYRIIYLKLSMNIQSYIYIKEVIIRCGILVLISIAIAASMSFIEMSSIVALAVYAVIGGILVLLIGLTPPEISTLRSKCQQLIFRFKS